MSSPFAMLRKIFFSRKYIGEIEVRNEKIYRGGVVGMQNKSGIGGRGWEKVIKNDILKKNVAFKLTY